MPTASGDTLKSPTISPEGPQEDPRITAAVTLALGECTQGKLALYCPGPIVNAGLAETSGADIIYVDDTLPEDTLRAMQKAGEEQATKIAHYSERSPNRWLPGRMIDAICFLAPTSQKESGIVGETPLAAGAIITWAGTDYKRLRSLHVQCNISLIGTIPLSEGVKPGIIDGDTQGYFVPKAYDDLTEEERERFCRAVKATPAIEEIEPSAELYYRLQRHPLEASTLAFDFPYYCNDPALFVYRRMPL